PPRHGDPPLRHGTVWILLGYGSENSPGLFIEERVQQRNATDEFWPRARRARHRKIYCSGRTQVAWLRDNCRFGGESCETGDQNGEKSGAAKEYSNAHAKAPSRLAQSSLSCKFENNFAASFFPLIRCI